MEKRITIGNAHEPNNWGIIKLATKLYEKGTLKVIRDNRVGKSVINIIMQQ